MRQPSARAAPRQGRCESVPESRRGSQRSLELDRWCSLDERARPCRAGALRGSRPAPVSPLDLLRWPGVVREAELDAEPVLAAALEGLLREALAELNDTRLREGPAHPRAPVNSQRCEAMRARVAAVRAAARDLAALRERIVERISQLGVAPDPTGSSRSWCCTRTRWTSRRSSIGSAATVDEIAAVLDSTEPAGRRLDFLMQELNREANTLSSKSQDGETTRAAVDMKVAIEQMREQVQNVE